MQGVLLIALTLSVVSGPGLCEVVFVDQNAPGPAHDGGSWDTAYITIQSAIDVATSGDQVWVADGTYAENIAMRDWVSVYGGFRGAEPDGYEIEVEQRDYNAHVATIDGGGAGTCVVMAPGARVDGFVVTNGVGANGRKLGGAFYCDGLGKTGSIENNAIIANSASARGGAIYCRSSSPWITANSIAANTASRGGGIYCELGSSPHVADNTITANTATYGGGIYCESGSSPSLTGNEISDNSANTGGGIYGMESSPVLRGNTLANNTASSGGGVYWECGSCPVVSANIIIGNSAGRGAGIYCDYYCALTLVNNIIAANVATDGGGGILVANGCSATLTNDTIAYNAASEGRGISCGYDVGTPSSIAIANCILWNDADEIANNDGSALTIGYSDVHGGWLGTGNIDADPLFVDAAAGDYHLTVDSPCINAGDINAPGLPETDFDDDPRVFAGSPDIGADEYVSLLIFVDQNAPGPIHDGLTWDTAMLTIQEGVATSIPGGTVWVAEGTYVENVVMPPRILLYGGFLGAEPGGYETSLAQRDFVAHIATIDGNQSGSCVVMSDDCGIDGFTITNGSGSVFAGDTYGGGICCLDCGSSVVIANNTIAANNAYSGAGICSKGYSAPLIAGNVICNNTAGGYGGGVSVVDYYSSATILRNTISGNQAGNGAGISWLANDVGDIIDNTITGNLASNRGGGMNCHSRLLSVTCNTISDNAATRQGGGIYCERGAFAGNKIFGNSADQGGAAFCTYGTISFTNNIMAANSSTTGGALYITGGTISFTNNTFWANTSGTGRAIRINGNPATPTSVTIVNCILWDGGSEIGVYGSPTPTVTVRYSDVQGAYSGTGNINADPLFVDPANGNLRLQSGSPCIDRATNNVTPILRTDAYGGLRLLDGDGNGSLVLDMGAAEYSPQGHVVTIIDDPTGDVTIDEDTALVFSGTAYRTDGMAIVDRLWQFGAGSGVPDSHAEDPGSVLFSDPGVYTVTFDAQAENGQWCPFPDRRQVTVQAVTPDVRIDRPAVDTHIAVGGYVDFKGSAADRNGRVVGWLWTFGEGSGVDDSHVQNPGLLQFNHAGKFTVTFSAQDNDGHWSASPATRTIYVEAGRVRVYVDRSSPGPTHDGSSWDCAYLTIANGIAAATPNGEVWVADGTYVENLLMGEGVAIYGGFLGAQTGGYETSLDQRDFANNVTKIDGNQIAPCVTMAGGARVDGFTIANGKGLPYGWGESDGGGIYCLRMDAGGIIANNIIANNTARRGAGIYCEDSSLTVTGNAITGNTSTRVGDGAAGAGIYCFRSSLVVTSNDISSNQAEQNAGICCWDSQVIIAGNTIESNVGGGVTCVRGSATLTGNTITANTNDGVVCSEVDAMIQGNTINGNTRYGVICSDATVVEGNEILSNGSADGYSGAGVYASLSDALIIRNTIAYNRTGTDSGVPGGGIVCFDGHPTVANNLIYNNSARFGGGIVLQGDECYAIVTNNTIVSNTGKLEGGGIHIAASSCAATLTNNIIAKSIGYGISASEPMDLALSFNDVWSNTLGDYSNVEPGTGDMSVDPLFTSEYRLRLGSPCIDTGDNTAEGMQTMDLDGNPRVGDGDGDGVAVVDLGAFEWCDTSEWCQAPSGWFVPGWVWFSVPLAPAGSGDAHDVLGYDCANRLFGWDDEGKSIISYPDGFTDLVPGPSYLGVLSVGESYAPTYPGNQPSRPFVWTLTAAGWCWVGTPGTQDIFGADVRVMRDGLVRTATEDYASTHPWINWNWIYWDPANQTARIMCPFRGADDHWLHPWYGYRVWANVDSVVVIFP